VSYTQLGLTELIRGERKGALDRTKAAAIYRPVLERLLVRAEGLPEEQKLPRVALLRAADGRRDGFGRAVWHLAQSVLATPDAPDELEAAANLVLERYVPSLAITRDTYAETARKAALHQAELQEHRAVLARVTAPDGRTLADLLAAFAAAGAEVGAHHQGRSTELASAGTRDEAAPLRSLIIGALNELRSVVQREMAHDATLPATLEAEIFGYFDEMQRLASQRRRSPVTPATPPAPATPPTP